MNDSTKDVNYGEFDQIETQKLRFKEGGITRCTAENYLGTDSQTALIMIGDLDKRFMVWRDNSDELISEDDPFTLHCGAIIYTYRDNLKWFFNNKPLEEGESSRYTITRNATDYSYRTTLTIHEATMDDAGKYKCQSELLTQNKVDKVDNRSLYVDVHKPEKPEVLDSNLYPEVMVKLGESIEFYCNMSGIPKPKIQWYKNDELLDENSNYNITSYSMRIPAVLAEHEATYRCVGQNKMSSAERVGQLIITGESLSLSLYYIQLSSISFHFTP